jgi:hypothetical protein
MTAKKQPAPQGRTWIASTVSKKPLTALERRKAAIKAQAAALAERALKVAEKPVLVALVRFEEPGDKDASGGKGVLPSATAGLGGVAKRTIAAATIRAINPATGQPKREPLPAPLASYPTVFFHGEPVPLKLLIHLDLRARHPELSATTIRRVLQKYCGSFRYQRCLKGGLLRWDLDGNPAGIVTMQQSEIAKQKIVDMIVAIQEKGLP